MSSSLSSVRKIVVAERDPAQREYLTAVLEDNGYEVLPAFDGAEALMLAQENQLDALVASLGGDDMEPMELASSLRGLPRQGRVVLILVTQPGKEETVRQAFEAGVDDYLCKPVQAEELLLRLHMCRRRRDSLWRPEEEEALLELTRLLASSLDIRELLHLVAVRTAQVLRVDRCSMVLVDENGEEATVLAASENASLGGIRVKLKNYPEIIEVIETQRPFVVERVEEHPKLKHILPHLVNKGIGSLALFPMLDSKRISGVLFLRSERFARPLSERDIFFANAVAAAVALSLRNLNLFERQRQVATELQRTKNFLENLIQSSADAIVAANLKGEIILFNRGAERIFGYTAEEVVGKLHVTKLYPPGGAREIMKLLRRQEKDGKYLLGPIRREVINKKGEAVPIQLSAWGVMEEGKLVATAGIFADLRERLNIERQLSQAQQKLIESEHQAMIAELAGATAHELNQPLTSILGYTELARRKIERPQDVARILDIIFSEAERMAEIVRKIGRVTRYETKSYVGSQRIMDIERSSQPAKTPGGEEGKPGEPEE
jgi:PAS domain S-box-containing protein